ncbi:MAG: XRE family transcriptional regulator [Myxococcales bacterium]|nr:XRE family transcriptional regulator [Myxococcales bacterium]
MSARGNATRAARRAALRGELADRIKLGDLDLVAAVRLMRRIADKSQADYARLVGISPRVLIDFERGVGNPTLRSLRKMLDPFGLELTVRKRSLDPPPPRRGMR